MQWVSSLKWQLDVWFSNSTEHSHVRRLLNHTVEVFIIIIYWVGEAIEMPEDFLQVRLFL